LRLDPRKVAALQRDSERVAQLLASVFEGETSAEEPAPAVADPHDNLAGESALGLDAKHSEFLKTLLGRSSWARSELEELAEDRGLPVDGALERLNDAALDKLNTPLFDEGDPIALNPEAVEGILGGEHSHA